MTKPRMILHTKRLATVPGLQRIEDRDTLIAAPDGVASEIGKMVAACEATLFCAERRAALGGVDMKAVVGIGMSGHVQSLARTGLTDLLAATLNGEGELVLTEDPPLQYTVSFSPLNWRVPMTVSYKPEPDSVQTSTGIPFSVELTPASGNLPAQMDLVPGEGDKLLSARFALGALPGAVEALTADILLATAAHVQAPIVRAVGLLQ